MFIFRQSHLQLYRGLIQSTQPFDRGILGCWLCHIPNGKDNMSHPMKDTSPKFQGGPKWRSRIHPWGPHLIVQLTKLFHHHQKWIPIVLVWLILCHLVVHLYRETQKRKVLTVDVMNALFEKLTTKLDIFANALGTRNVFFEKLCTIAEI